MPKLLYVPIRQEAIRLLCDRANSERRRPQDEAAILLEKALGLCSCAVQSATAEHQREVPDAATD